MEKRKEKRKSGRDIKFITFNSLEATRDQLWSLESQRLVLGHPHFYLRGYTGDLHVEDSFIDNDTLEFRVWIKRFMLDVQVAGFLKRQTDKQTFVAGELQIGLSSYLLHLFLVLAVIDVLINSRLNQSLILIGWLGFLAWFYWRMTHRYANKLAHTFENTLMDDVQN